MYRLGHYIPRISILHALDPRVKLTAVVFLSVLILKGDVYMLTILTVFLLLLVPLARLKPTHLASAFRPMIFFLALLFFMHLFFTQGRPVPPFPPWRVTVTYEGLYTGALTTWQFLLLILNASILTMTTVPSDLITGIERLLRPLRIVGVPSYDVAMMVSIALRFVPTMLDELDRMKEAQRVRGASFRRGPLRQRVKTATSLLVPLIQTTIRRADELATAMECRGYRRGPRTTIRDLRMASRDYWALLALLALGAGFAIRVLGMPVGL